MQRDYNEIIGDLASQANYRLADVSNAFEGILEEEKNTDYLCRNFWNTSFWDGLRCKIPGGADRLSYKRDLKLTIDGVHLNSRGAKLYAQTILAAIEEQQVSYVKPELSEQKFL